MAKKRRDSRPANIAELTADPGNPRGIERTAADGLAASIDEFGDISGVVFNLRTRELVSGHQRVERLVDLLGSDIEIRYESGSDRGYIPTPEGDFAVRLVDWPKEKQLAANLAANNKAIQGHDLADELKFRLSEVKQTSGELYEMLLLDRLEVSLDSPDVEEAPPNVEKEILGSSSKTLNCQLTDEQAQAIQAAVERAKQNPQIKTLAEALAAIAVEYTPKRSGKKRTRKSTG